MTPLRRGSLLILDVLWLGGPQTSKDMRRRYGTAALTTRPNLRRSRLVGRDGAEWYLTPKGFLRLEAGGA